MNSCSHLLNPMQARNNQILRKCLMSKNAYILNNESQEGCLLRVCVHINIFYPQAVGMWFCPTWCVITPPLPQSPCWTGDHCIKETNSMVFITSGMSSVTLQTSQPWWITVRCNVKVVWWHVMNIYECQRKKVNSHCNECTL
jgi:hypothetical protein